MRGRGPYFCEVFFWVGKRVEGGCVASSHPVIKAELEVDRVLPVIEVKLNGKSHRALVDTGCSLFSDSCWFSFSKRLL